MHAFRLLALWLLALATLSITNSYSGEPAEVDATAAIFPPEVDLTGEAASQRVLLQKLLAGEVGGAVAGEVRWSVADPQIAAVESGVVTAHGDGETVLSAEWTDAGGQSRSASAPVHVKASAGPLPIEFNNHVQAVLSKAACNSGGCHGALAGKGGFRLSLNAYDPVADHYAMTREDRARRVDLSAPDRSLLLIKPAARIAHKGGLRLPYGGEDYRLLRDWIAADAEGPRPEDPKLEELRVYPPSLRLSPGDSQQVLVAAVYDNGRVEDVTRWAKFTSTDESVALVDPSGTMKIIASGQTSISVWFGSRLAASRVLVPYADELPQGAFDALAEANPIDTAVKAHLRRLNLAPSSTCTDGEFVRRVYLDTIGKPPTAAETLEFLGDSSSDKRSRLIDALLQRDEYVDYWAYRWADLFMLNGAILQADGVAAYGRWIREQVASNTPWDQFAREILTATGESLENGATNFYAVNQDPESMTENACQAFMGLSIGCAKCHNHPLEKWTNDQYYAMANMFARVRAKGWSGETRNGDAKRTVLVLDRGDLIQPGKGVPQPPAPLDAPPLDIDDPVDRRVVLAEWMTSPENPYFTRAVVNRVWHAYFGVGIIDPVDDLRASNPASNPELMEYLCGYLVEHDYDLKSLMRLILNSQTYQRSSHAAYNNAADTRLFSHYFPRRLMAEVLHDAIAEVTTVDSEFTQIEFPGADRRKVDHYAKGTRAVELFDSAIENQFLKTFGRNQRRIVCECERSNEPSIVQVLHINNGQTINDRLAAEQGIVTQFLKQYEDDDAALIQAAYLRTLSREPTDAESAAFVEELAAGDDAAERRLIVEDLFWSLMSSREFLFNR